MRRSFYFILILFNLYFINNITLISQVTAPANPSSTCYGVCCDNGLKSLTIDINCYNNGFNGLFTLLQNITCPTSPDIIPIAGCTHINQTGIFNSTIQCTRTIFWGKNK